MATDNIYRKKTCDLCDREVYEKHLGTATVTDGGFTRHENYERSGFGTMTLNFFDIHPVNYSRMELDLCPECALKIEKAVLDKIREIKGRMPW